MAGPSTSKGNGTGVRLRLARVVDRVRTSLWVTPAAFVLGAFLLLVVIVQVDVRVEAPALASFGGDAGEARDVASTVASAMLTFIGVVFSVTIVALQLASGQYSPRVMRTFLRDRVTKATLGWFVASFTYAILLVGIIETSSDGVPDFAIAALYVLVLGSIGMFIWYIHSIAHSLRAVAILDSVATETRHAIERVFPDRREARDPEPRPRWSSEGRLVRRDGPGGVVVAVDVERLLAAALEADCTVELLHGVGDFVRGGAPIARVAGSGAADASLSRISDAVKLGSERTMVQDPEFGLRQLVDIAERALSPGTNDPTTAVQAIDRLHDLLGMVADRDFPPTVARDEDGIARVYLPRRSWDDLVSLACDGIRLNARTAIAVHRRLRGMLEDLRSITNDQRRRPVEEQLGQLAAVAREHFTLSSDAAAAGGEDVR